MLLTALHESGYGGKADICWREEK